MTAEEHNKTLATLHFVYGGIHGLTLAGLLLMIVIVWSTEPETIRLSTKWIAVGVAKLAAFVKETPPAARSCEAAKMQLENNVRPEHVECVTVPELALRAVLDRGAIAMPRLHRREQVVDALAAVIAPPLQRDVTEKLDM